MGEFTTWDIDTTPGGKGLFAPPAGWDGNEDQYIALLRQRWSDFAYKQILFCTLRAERYHPWEFRGPFKKQAFEILRKLRNRWVQTTAQPAVA